MLLDLKDNTMTPKNVQFTIVVKMNGRMREVNFLKRTDIQYDADASDELSHRWLFKWILENESWKIIPVNEALPAWLTDNASAIKDGFLTGL